MIFCLLYSTYWISIWCSNKYSVLNKYAWMYVQLRRTNMRWRYEDEPQRTGFTNYIAYCTFIPTVFISRCLINPCHTYICFKILRLAKSRIVRHRLKIISRSYFFRKFMFSIFFLAFISIAVKLIVNLVIN